MRSKMERLIILPFSAGCISEASVAVDIQQPRGTRPNSTSTRRSKEAEDDSESLSGENMKQSLGYLVVPKSNISAGFHRLFKGFKNFSQLFMDSKELEEQVEETDMEIGSPTDVQHVTHIGLDYSCPDIINAAHHPMSTTVRGLDHLLTSMDAHAHAHADPPLTLTTFESKNLAQS